MMIELEKTCTSLNGKLRIDGENRNLIKQEVYSKGTMGFKNDALLEKDQLKINIKDRSLRKMTSEFAHRFRMDKEFRVDCDKAKLFFEFECPGNNKKLIHGFVHEIHSNPFGAILLSEFQFFKPPKAIVSDFTWANITALMKAVNNLDIIDYLSLVFHVIVDKQLFALSGNKSIIYLCSTHFLKNIQDDSRNALKIMNGEKAKKIYYLFIGAFCLLQNSICLNVFNNILKCMKIVFTSKYRNERFQVNYITLKTFVLNNWVEIVDQSCNNCRKTKITEDNDEKKFVFIENKEVSYVKVSPFTKYFNDLLEFDQEIETPTKNSYYVPKLFEKLSKKLHLMPFWCGILLSYFNINETRLSNNYVEKWFQDIKINLFRKQKRVNKFQRFCPNEFITPHYFYLKSEYKRLYEDHFNMNFVDFESKKENYQTERFSYEKWSLPKLSRKGNDISQNYYESFDKKQLGELVKKIKLVDIRLYEDMELDSESETEMVANVQGNQNDIKVSDDEYMDTNELICFNEIYDSGTNTENFFYYKIDNILIRKKEAKRLLNNEWLSGDVKKSPVKKSHFNEEMVNDLSENDNSKEEKANFSQKLVDSILDISSDIKNYQKLSKKPSVMWAKFFKIKKRTNSIKALNICKAKSLAYSLDKGVAAYRDTVAELKDTNKVVASEFLAVNLSLCGLLCSNFSRPETSTPDKNRSFDIEINTDCDFDPIIRTNEVSFLHESLKEVNSRLNEKDLYIEELKSQCERITSQISQNWRECFDEKLLEINSLKMKLRNQEKTIESCVNNEKELNMLIQNQIVEKELLESQIEKLNKNIEEINTSRTDLKSRIEHYKELIDRFGELNKEIENLENEKETLARSESNLISQLEESKSEYEELKSSNKFEEKVRHLNLKIKELESDKMKLMNSNTSLKSCNEKLKEEIDKRKSFNIPFAGSLPKMILRNSINTSCPYGLCRGQNNVDLNKKRHKNGINCPLNPINENLNTKICPQRCFACEGVNDCNDPFSYNKDYFYTCPVGSYVCQKIVYNSIYGVRQVVRRCVSLCPVGQTTYNGLTAVSYCCNTVECNQSQSKTQSKLIAVVQLSAYFIFSLLR
ncbi:hypothetical protein BpHYR1_043057 [Brachionus plicatilis]|uniref:Uncharacterized protein n=1 Tax=Brachionus plicatilis TaxID=10195 RepID=A0A3M7RFF6_BRAPC|nr:hypothetical protein BpHYR1_043057 [Brachionus plicatilis]